MIIKIKSSMDFDLSPFGIDEIWVDVDKTGQPTREIGFLEGAVVHRYPGSGKYGDYGVFDMNVFQLENLTDSPSDASKFDEKWTQ